MDISVSSYSFAQLMSKGVITQADTVSEAHKLGFNKIEFTELSKDGYAEQVEYAKEIKKRCDDLGMKISSYTVGANLFQPEIEKEIDRLKKQLEIAKILDVPNMRHDACWSLSDKGAGRSFGLMLPYIADAARNVTEYAETLGIKTCVENHGYIAQDSYRMEQLFNAVAHDNFGLLIDMGNFVCADEDSAMAVSRLAPYAIYVHAKDMHVYPAHTPHGYLTRGGNRFEGAVIGEGVIPIEQDIIILKRAGYDGTVAIEYEGDKDCIEGIRAGLKFLKSAIEQAERVKY